MSVRFGMLSLLRRHPMHGYQLRQEFEASTGSTWPLNVGQVYTTLGRLERDGLIEATDTGDESQRVFAISAAGRVAVDEWFATPVRPQSPPRDELAIKLALAVATPGVDVRSVIQTQRTSTVRALQEYTRAREAAGDDLPWLLVADSLIFAAEAEVRWLDHCETRLARRRAVSVDQATAVGGASPERPTARAATTEGTRR
jgi:DNA-binding PadR family transcriptional regulator